MEDMKVTPTDYDFRPAHPGMERYVDGDILSGVSSAVLVGRDLVAACCVRVRLHWAIPSQPTDRHLLSHSSGLSGRQYSGTIIFEAYNERKVFHPATTLAEMTNVLADLPLVFQPGTSWEYLVASDVMAGLVEVISGRAFDQFIQSRILDPLGMVDTGSSCRSKIEAGCCVLRRCRPDEAGSHSHR
jgi:Beta-lactamase